MVISNDTINLEKLVLEPIIFLDLFSFPPTAWEVWQYLNERLPFLKVESVLSFWVSQKVISEKQGFYFLSGKDDLISIRKHRYNYSANKLKKARFFAKLFTFFPGVLAVSAANFIGSHNWRQNSDIDLFIITKKGYLWRSRLFCAGLAKILFSRPTKKNKKDKICLSFYVSENALNLKNLELVGGDPYFKYWRQGLLPLYVKGNIWKKFLQANQGEENKEGVKYIKKNFLENLAKKIQLRIMSPQLKKEINKSEGVVINDDVLKLYLTERRREFLDNFNLKRYEIFKTIN